MSEKRWISIQSPSYVFTMDVADETRGVCNLIAGKSQRTSTENVLASTQFALGGRNQVWNTILILHEYM